MQTLQFIDYYTFEGFSALLMTTLLIIVIGVALILLLKQIKPLVSGFTLKIIGWGFVGIVLVLVLVVPIHKYYQSKLIEFKEIVDLGDNCCSDIDTSNIFAVYEILQKQGYEDQSWERFKKRMLEPKWRDATYKLLKDLGYRNIGKDETEFARILGIKEHNTSKLDDALRVYRTDSENDAVSKLYDGLRLKGYTEKQLGGSEDRFRIVLGDTSVRREFYDWVVERGDFGIGEWEKYNNRIATSLEKWYTKNRLNLYLLLVANGSKVEDSVAEFTSKLQDKTKRKKIYELLEENAGDKEWFLEYTFKYDSFEMFSNGLGFY